MLSLKFGFFKVCIVKSKIFLQPVSFRNVLQPVFFCNVLQLCFSAMFSSHVFLQCSLAVSFHNVLQPVFFRNVLQPCFLQCSLAVSFHNVLQPVSFRRVVVCFCEGRTVRGLLTAIKANNLEGYFHIIGRSAYRISSKSLKTLILN